MALVITSSANYMPSDAHPAIFCIFRTSDRQAHTTAQLRQVPLPDGRAGWPHNLLSIILPSSHASDVGSTTPARINSLLE